MQWSEITQWRRSQRERLLDQRIKAGHKQRSQWNDAIEKQLRAWFADKAKLSVGYYWPFKGEFDARPLIEDLLEQGHTAALPAVVEKNTPLQFWRYTTGDELEPGIWKIPVPKCHDIVIPDVLIVPLVGYDPHNYRLGYGGGYYDRTLAQMPESTITLGVGYTFGRLDTIHPQSFDIPLSEIFTERSG